MRKKEHQDRHGSGAADAEAKAADAWDGESRGDWRSERVEIRK